MIPSARATIDDLTSQVFDVLVIGGGATGGGIAREAALRGMKVALVEKGDFASGTSSRSSRLIHGGLRYLEHRQWSLVRESLAERSVLHRIAPHLVRHLDFLFPIFRGDRVGRWKLEIGLSIYDLLAAGGNVRRHRPLGKRAVKDVEPELRERGLKGGALYSDAQCDDARLSLATIRSAAANGARVANYLEVTGFTINNHRVDGATVRDMLTGQSGRVECRQVINATGPWCDVVRRLEDPKARPLLKPTKGAHVMVARSRIRHSHPITFQSPVDGRVMFVLPWGDRSYIGTTDTDTDDSPDEVNASENEIQYLLRSANAIFPAARLSFEDVSLTWAGVRPLLSGLSDQAPGARSREHVVTIGPRGMVTVAGGKLTTYRRMAIQTLDFAARQLDRSQNQTTDPMQTRSATEPLPGGSPYNSEALFAEGVREGFSDHAAAHLVGQYGSETPTIYEAAAESPLARGRLHPEHGAIGAQVLYAVRAEYARRLDDVMFRRISIAYETADGGFAAVEPVARLMSEELGWNETTRRQEIERYYELAQAIPRGRGLSS